MKSDLLVCLEDISAAQSVAPSVTSAVIDGAAIVQILKRGSVKTFQEYADEVFIPYISGELRNVSSLDVVWDSYKVDSLKATARANGAKESTDVLLPQHPYLETGRTSYVWTSTRRKLSASF